MAERDYALGKILCKGSGLKAYFEIVLHDSEGKPKTFRYEVGSLQQFLTQTKRQSSWNYVAGRSNPVGVNKGLRSSYGTITFQQMDSGVLYEMISDLKKWDEEGKKLIDANADIFGYSFDDYTLAEENAALLGGPSETNDYTLHKNDIIMLDDLPPINVIVVGTADQIDPTTGVYDVNKTYMFKAEKVTFLSETFGISAGAPLHNVAAQVIILGEIHPWRVIE